MPPKHVRTQSNLLYSARERTIGHQRCHSSAVGSCPKAFEEQGVKSVHGEDVGVEVGKRVCEEVNARHAAQPGSGSIALYRRLRLGQ